MANSSEACGCCDGTEAVTPESTANRPGLPTLAYRVGAHSSFLETMLARLSSFTLEVSQVDGAREILHPLDKLKTRASNDPAIAMLDGWATIADVLTFYQERIANEGYLRTATERRSILELARLVGYTLGLGVAASVFLALELDKDHEVTIQPYEIKAQSIPGPGELPQTFENVEPLETHYEWNNLKPRLTQPQTLKSIEQGDAISTARLYIKGINANLKSNDVFLITVGNQPYKVYSVIEAKPEAEPEVNRTLVILKEKSYQPFSFEESFDAAGIAEIARKYIEEALKAGVDRDMEARVIEHLKELSVLTKMSETTARRIARERIARIAEERDVAVGEQYSRLSAWLTALTKELTEKATGIPEAEKKFESINDPLKSLITRITKPTSIPPRNSFTLDRKIQNIFTKRAEIGLRMISVFDSRLRRTVPGMLANAKVTDKSDIRAYVFRAVARPFGHNAPPRAVANLNAAVTYQEWKTNEPLGTVAASSKEVMSLIATPMDAGTRSVPPYQSPDLLYLDGEYKIQSNGWTLVEGPELPATETTGNRLFLNLVSDVDLVPSLSLAAYGMSGKTTLLMLKGGLSWFEEKSEDPNSFSPVRTTVVHTESEELLLAEEPIETSICDGKTETIELDGLYSDLQSGRWLIVSGERDDIVDENNNKVRGVHAAELVMLAEVLHQTKTENGQTSLPGDRIHTFLKLEGPLSYCYKRDTVTIYGNVVKATHGETRRETLGAGDAAQAFQSFTLKQPPVTFISSPTSQGAESTLKIYVNDMQWREVDGLADLSATDRKFITKTDDESKTTVIFGNGQRGARLPTGLENVRAVYRNGNGRLGNVRAEQISLLLSKPLGVKGLINPLRASGGADKENRDNARQNAPLTVTALDRLVSVSDYADFARTFAGVDKAVAVRLHQRKRSWIHVTIAGADDIPIDETSELHRNLLQALRDFGDPYQPVALQVRELGLLVISAKIRILPELEWGPVAKALRARLLDTFAFERRELGQNVHLSEVISAMQSVRGVAYVDLDVLGSVPEKKSDIDKETGKPIRRLLSPQEIAEVAKSFIDKQSQPGGKPDAQVLVNLAGFEDRALRPAQLVCLTPDVADTLVLNQIQ